MILHPMSSVRVGAGRPTLPSHPLRYPMKRPGSIAARTADSVRLFARLPTVVQAPCLGRSTIYRLVAIGEFPAPVHLGPRAVAWRWSDLDQWSESRRSGAN